MTEPPRPPYRYEKNEKEDEKRRGNEEKTRGEKSWDEKWRRDAINAVCWAAIFIWAGLILLAETTGWGYDMFPRWWNTWPMILVGAGAILMIGVIARLVMPEHRRPIVGNFIFSIILLGIGLESLVNFQWEAIGAIALIAVGLAIVLGGVFRKRK